MNTNVPVIAGFAVLAAVVTILRRKLAANRPPAKPDLSWDRLSERYKAEGLSGADVFEKLGGKVGKSYAGVGGDAQGLILWHPGYLGARIPWPEAELISGTFMGIPSLLVRAAGVPDVEIIIPRRFEDRLKAKAGEAWPGVTTLQDAEPGGGAA
jgi:hypothetical protein